jgi:hypothetical protein
MELNLDLMEMIVWAQRYMPPPRSRPPDAGAAVGLQLGICCCWGFFMLAFGLVPLIGMWKAFDKAGKPGWAAIVPIYNAMVMAEIAGKDPVYGLLTLIPVVGIVFAIILTIEFCKVFDVGAGFAIGLILLPFVFWPMLGFGKARYVGLGGGRPRRRRPRYEDEYEEEERPRRRRSDRIQRGEDEDY